MTEEAGHSRRTGASGRARPQSVRSLRNGSVKRPVKSCAGAGVVSPAAAAPSFFFGGYFVFVQFAAQLERRGDRSR
ncbi:hypothetical protein EVAR_94557_1 [Eumeta japonica]|uniref:Uncharacterized protein n=1 Tax=Eumeta variegata TaxID=151549 RepID=A0A4C1UUX9_EUMVA|nr:hypothetical protein EVAR_94557_1 [Eumeta japonica]